MLLGILGYQLTNDRHLALGLKGYYVISHHMLYINQIIATV